MRPAHLFLLLVMAALAAPGRTQAQLPPEPQSQPAITLTQRIFPDVGAGVIAIRRTPSGNYLVLVSPGPAVLVFDASGKKAGQIPAQPVGAQAIAFGAALDVDSSGRVYVADRGGNAVNVYSPDGSLAARVHVEAPVAVAALSRDEFAVSRVNSTQLIAIYDLHGTLLREFGDPVSPTPSPSLNQRMNLGILASDADGNLYFAFEYLPEPTVRKYDRFGYLADEFTITDPAFEATEQAARRDLARAKPGALAAPQQIVSAIGVDPATEEMWIALGDLLVHTDRDGRELDVHTTQTPAGASLVARFIGVESGRLLLGNDLRGAYTIPRPKTEAPAN